MFQHPSKKGMEDINNRLQNVIKLITSRYDYILTGPAAIYIYCEKYAPHLTPNISFPNNIEFFVDEDFETSTRSGSKDIYAEQFGDYRKTVNYPKKIVTYYNQENNNLRFTLNRKYINRNYIVELDGLNIIRPDMLISYYDHDKYQPDHLNKKYSMYRAIINEIFAESQ